MPPPEPTRKRIRLTPDSYADPSAICSITIVTADRLPILRNDVFAIASIEVLERRATLSGTLIHAYCFMPDHVHLLLAPQAGQSLTDFVRDFKGETTRLAWQSGRSGPVWQRSFFDHFLRRDEDVERSIRYILDNPVRAGLVTDGSDYAYSSRR